MGLLAVVCCGVLSFGVLAPLWLVEAAWVVLFDSMFVCVCVCCASDNGLGAEGGAAVADAMKSCTQLTSVNLECMCCGIAVCLLWFVCVVLWCAGTVMACGGCVGVVV